MFVFYDGTKYNLTPLEIIDLVKKGYFSPDTEVEYKGKIHKLSEFKEIRLLFKKLRILTKKRFLIITKILRNLLLTARENR